MLFDYKGYIRRLFTISFLPEHETQMALGKQVRRKESQVGKAVKVK